MTVVGRIKTNWKGVGNLKKMDGRESQIIKFYDYIKGHRHRGSKDVEILGKTQAVKVDHLCFLLHFRYYKNKCCHAVKIERKQVSKSAEQSFFFVWLEFGYATDFTTPLLSA